MYALNSPKKRGKKPQDWHPALISAKLKMCGSNLSKLAEENGLHRSTLRSALYRPYPKAEKIIAEKLGISPAEIWASRYQND